MRKRNLAARNKRRSVRLCGVCFGLAMAASGCGADERQYNMAEEAGIQNVQDEQKNWMGGLSREQRLADFESLCDGLRENYPYVKLAKRQEGADLDALEVSYREKVGQCANDNAFYETLSDFIREFSFTGHLDLWGRRYESELAYLREYVKESGESAKYEPYIDALDNPVSQSTYAAMTKYYQGSGVWWRRNCQQGVKRAERLREQQ